MFVNIWNRRFFMADAGAGTGDAGGAAGAGEKPWFDGLDAEVKGYVTTRGLDKKNPTEAFVEAYKSHKEAEKFVGAPANEVIRLPKEANAPEWQQVHERLGKPKDAKDYDFAAVKRAGDKPLDQALTDTLRQAAFDANLNKDGATRVATALVKHLDGIDSAVAAAEADKLATEKATLKKNWGTNEAANMVVAQAAVRALGVEPEAVAALEKAVGYAKVMDMFRNIGSKIGEDKFVSITRPGGPGTMTRDEAVAEKATLKSDKAWVDRYLAGGTEEKRKLETLDRIIVGVA